MIFVNVIVAAQAVAIRQEFEDSEIGSAFRTREFRIFFSTLNRDAGNELPTAIRILATIATKKLILGRPAPGVGLRLTQGAINTFFNKFRHIKAPFG